jgi:hypothetical protein
MNLVTIKWIGVGGMILIGAWATLHFMGAHESRVSAKAEAASIVQQQAATQSAAQGAANVQAAQVQASTVQQDDAQVAKDRLRVHVRVSTPPTPGAPNPQPVVQPDPVDGAKDQLIADLTKQIADQQSLIATLNLAVTHYRAAYEDEVKASNLKQIALEAQIAANKSSKWMGRIQGFAIGAAIGYAGGKL